jgi:hypothetical protein
MARNAVDETTGALHSCHYLLHDRDANCAAFDELLASDGIHVLKLPPLSPNLKAFAKRCVRSVKEECLSKLILFGDFSLARALAEFVAHYHSERNDLGKGAYCSSLPRCRKEVVAMSAAASVSAACFDTIAGPLE